MRSKKAIEETVRTKLNLTLAPPLRDQLLARALQEQEQSQPKNAALSEPSIGSILMKNSMVKLGIAAVVIAVLGIGVVEFLDTGSTSGVLWADVVRKIEANRGFTFHEKIRVVYPDRPEQVVYVVDQYAGSRLHQEWSMVPDGPPFKSVYLDFETATATYLQHTKKTCLQTSIDEKTVRSQESGWLNPKDWIRQFLSSTYSKLGRRTIDGVPCEGIETTNPTFADCDPPAAKLVARLWVNVETGYPVRLECSCTLSISRAQVEFLCDRFDWNADLNPSLFEPNIPDDYTRLK
ncbi:MAG: hypothetical protein JW993_00215 [Sedimentisphaerales bacterium]|nr:hypothetical protein [Sedimentisphaerales bacterium]